MTISKENFYSFFQSRLNKIQVVDISTLVSDSKELFDEMIDIMMNDKPHASFMASWVMGYAGIKQPAWFYSRLPEILDRLEKPAHESVLRNTLRVIWKTTIPREMDGPITQKCLELVEDKESTIAAKAFSFHILFKIIEHEPELCHEIKDIAESVLPYASAGVANTAQKLLKKISKMGY